MYKSFLIEGSKKTWVMTVENDGYVQVSTTTWNKLGFREWDSWSFWVTREYLEAKLPDLIEAFYGKEPWKARYDWKCQLAFSRFLFAQ